MSKAKTTSSQFPVEYFQVWELAKQNKLKLTLETKGKATNMKQRLYSFRKRLCDEGNPLGFELMGLDLLSRLGDNGEGILESYQPEWKAQLKQLASTPELDSIEIPGVDLPPLPFSEAKENLETTLNSLGFGTKHNDNK